MPSHHAKRMTLTYATSPWGRPDVTLRNAAKVMRRPFDSSSADRVPRLPLSGSVESPYRRGGALVQPVEAEAGDESSRPTVNLGIGLEGAWLRPRVVYGGPSSERFLR
jgi:hypothetical protein